MMKKLYHFLPALVFLLFLGSMTFLLFLLPKQEYSANEKRKLAETPVVTAAALIDGKTQEELETFTSDHVPGRDFFVGVNAYWNLATGRNAAQDIYYGKDGWLINAPKVYDRQIFTDNLSRFDQFAEKTGLPADMIMVPSTGYLMEEKLPAFHGSYHDDTLYDQGLELLEHIRLVDVRQVLKEGKGEGEVCYHTDHHLSSYGNYLISRAYQQSLELPFLDRSAFSVAEYDGFYGTTWSGSGYWFTPADKVETWESGVPVTVSLSDGEEATVSDSLFFPQHLEEMDKYPIFLDGNHALTTIENPAAEGGSLLIIRDSYAHCLATLLAPYYRTIYLVDLRYYRTPVSAFLAEHPVDRLLFLYGVDNLVSDTNSAWLS